MRFRLRTGIVLVAMVALVMAMVRRREYCLERVRYHHSVRGVGRTSEGHMFYAGMFMGLREIMREHAAWHNKIADRLSYAAAHPWLPIPTEPPEPPTFENPESRNLLRRMGIEPSAATN